MSKRKKLLGTVLYLGAGQAYLLWRSKVSGKPINFDGFMEYAAEHTEGTPLEDNRTAARVAWGGLYGACVLAWPLLGVRRAYLTVKDLNDGGAKPETPKTDRS